VKPAGAVMSLEAETLAAEIAHAAHEIS